jgi:hypothetical protein
VYQGEIFHLGTSGYNKLNKEFKMSSDYFIPKRRFGIEVEFLFSTEREIERIVRQGFPIWVSPRKIPAFGSTNKFNRNTDWKLVTEPSVRNLDGTVGFEMNSPPLIGEDGLQQISHIIDMLNDCGAMIHDSCGLHVHYEIGFDFDFLHFQNLLKLQLNLEDCFDCLVDFNRRDDNPYCKSNFNPFYDYFENDFRLDRDEVLWTKAGRRALIEKAYALLDDRDILKRLILGSRYHKLNMGAVTEHDTVEIRHHHGSLDYPAIANWIQLQMAFVEMAKNSVKIEPAKEFFVGPQKAFSSLLVNDKVVEYYIYR